MRGGRGEDAELADVTLTFAVHSYGFEWRIV